MSETSVNRGLIKSSTIDTFSKADLSAAVQTEEGFKVDWRKVLIPDQSGIYALRLTKAYPGWRRLKLVEIDGPKTIGKIPYRPENHDKCDGWVYVGTTFTGIRTRIQRQLRPSNVNGNMIYRAMGKFFSERTPVEAVFRYGTIYWKVFASLENTANRFFVETKLISELFPIFNTKSEH